MLSSLHADARFNNESVDNTKPEVFYNRTKKRVDTVVQIKGTYSVIRKT